MFGALSTVEGAPPGVLAEVAREFSPRIEVCSPTEIVLDLSGLTRLFGEARTIAEELRRTAADRGLRVRVAIAGTRTAARLLVRYRAGLTIVEPGNEAAAVAPLPIALLGDLLTIRNLRTENSEPRTPNRIRRIPDPGVPSPESRISSPPSVAGVCERSAILRHCRPTISPHVSAVRTRTGSVWLAEKIRVRWCLLVPEERFEQTLELEWPIEELEPLSFVLGRLMESLEAHLEQRDRGAAVLHVRLHLIKTDGTTREVHERSLQLPVPIRDARTLRTLALLDLESNPPSAAIDRVTVAVDPTPARIVQFSLLTRPLPSPEQISTLMARLHALMGETRCGSPATVDSWEPGAFAMKPFNPGPGTRDSGSATRRIRESGTSNAWSPKPAARSPVTTALRRFRHPMPIRVHVKQGKPSSVSIMQRGLSGGAIDSCAGPWRTSGGWWESGIGIRTPEPNPRIPIPNPGSQTSAWDRDEWDVALTDGPTYRLFRERHSDKWFLEGVID